MGATVAPSGALMCVICGTFPAVSYGVNYCKACLARLHMHSSSMIGSGSHGTHTAPYVGAVPVQPVALTPEERARTVTVECGGREFSYTLDGRHLGTDLPTAEREQREAALLGAQRAYEAQQAALQGRYAKALAAHDAAGITNPVTGVIHDPKTLAPLGPGPLNPTDDATEAAWMEAKSSAWSRLKRKLVAR